MNQTTSRNFVRSKMQEQLKKLSYLFSQATAVKSIEQSNLTDADKRAYLRYFFVIIDNLLKIAPQVKNLANKLEIIDKSEEDEFKRLIKVIDASYTGSYDTIRDKLSAHQQNLPLDETISWWGDIDASSINVLYDDLRALKVFIASKRLAIDRDLRIEKFPATFESEKKFVFNAGRFGLGTEGAVSIVPGHETQEKAGLVSSAIDFLQKDFWLTASFDDPQSEHFTHLNNIGWLLALIDFTSLLDCIYSDDKEKSLVKVWEDANMSGIIQLKSIPRDQKFEADIRVVRNKIAAHLDTVAPLEQTLKLFYDLDVTKFYEYVAGFLKSFFDACRSDIRTRHMLAHNVELNGVIALAKDDSIKPFHS